VARARLEEKPTDRTALRALTDALRAQGRFVEATETTRVLVANAGRGRTTRFDALSAHAFALLAAVEAGQLRLEKVDAEITSSVQQAQDLASTGTVLAGTHALHHLVHGRLAEAASHAREAIAWDGDRVRRADDLVTLSEALAGLGEDVEATSSLHESRSLWADNPRLRSAAATLGNLGVAPA
jgi:hypothetical protein